MAKIRRNLLIVCEGSVTEPDYFALLKQKSLELSIWDAITIQPKPRSEQDDEQSLSPPAHKSRRPRRQLKNIEADDEADETECHFNWRQTPVNFVKAARDGLKDNTFEEVWAVFDCNGHPGHEQAFQLATEPVEGKTVNIAFSSIAFEHWVLLHFERNQTAFVKSECKNAAGRYLNCGTGNTDEDCWGERCVAGLLRTNGYLDGSTKQFNAANRPFFEKLLEPDLFIIACTNAAWLRNKVAHDPVRPFLTNPFTNVDALCKRLLGTEHETIEWANLNEPKTWQKLEIHIEIENGKLKFSILNLGSSSRLFNGADISAFVLQNEGRLALPPDPNSSMQILASEQKFFQFGNIPDLQNSVLEIRTGFHQLFIDLANK